MLWRGLDAATALQRLTAGLEPPTTPAALRAALAAASYALMVLENGRLLRGLTSSVRELSASRARILAATDRARRRIERDVHDGAQQRLVALRIKLALESERQVHASPETAAKLEQLGAEVDETIDAVRSIAHGIYPSLLSDRGLVDALRAAALSAPVTCTLDADGVGRQPPEIESAVYFACVAAVGNVAGGATRIAITLWTDQRLRFAVQDDGPVVAARSGAGPVADGGARPAGRGRRRARDRRRGGEGTRLAGSVPLR